MARKGGLEGWFVTRRNCIRKRVLQALVGGVLLVMGRRGTHVCLVADGGYSIRRSGVPRHPFLFYISHLCPPLTADKPHCVPQCSSSPLTSSPFSFRSSPAVTLLPFVYRSDSATSFFIIFPPSFLRPFRDIDVHLRTQAGPAAHLPTRL